jgi:hypothetical protein
LFVLINLFSSSESAFENHAQFETQRVCQNRNI